MVVGRRRSEVAPEEADIVELDVEMAGWMRHVVPVAIGHRARHDGRGRRRGSCRDQGARLARRAHGRQLSPGCELVLDLGVVGLDRLDAGFDLRPAVDDLAVRVVGDPQRSARLQRVVGGSVGQRRREAAGPRISDGDRHDQGRRPASVARHGRRRRAGRERASRGQRDGILPILRAPDGEAHGPRRVGRRHHCRAVGLALRPLRVRGLLLRGLGLAGRRWGRVPRWQGPRGLCSQAS